MRKVVGTHFRVDMYAHAWGDQQRALLRHSGTGSNLPRKELSHCLCHWLLPSIFPYHSFNKHTGAWFRFLVTLLFPFLLGKKNIKHTRRRWLAKGTA